MSKDTLVNYSTEPRSSVTSALNIPNDLHGSPGGERDWPVQLFVFVFIRPAPRIHSRGLSPGLTFPLRCSTRTP